MEKGRDKWKKKRLSNEALNVLGTHSTSSPLTMDEAVIPFDCSPQSSLTPLPSGNYSRQAPHLSVTTPVIQQSLRLCNDRVHPFLKCDQSTGEVLKVLQQRLHVLQIPPVIVGKSHRTVFVDPRLGFFNFAREVQQSAIVDELPMARRCFFAKFSETCLDLGLEREGTIIICPFLTQTLIAAINKDKIDKQPNRENHPQNTTPEDNAELGSNPSNATSWLSHKSYYHHRYTPGT